MSDPFASALCVNRRWWPWDDTATDQPHLWKAAASLCQRCPARAVCIARAHRVAHASGMWGGVRLGDDAWRGADGHRPYVEDERLSIESRATPISDAAMAWLGSMPNDGGGNLLVSEEEYDEVVADPIAQKYVRELLSAREMLHGRDRWCLWLVDADPDELRASPLLTRRISAVHRHRSRSRSAETRSLARTPHVFGQIRQPTVDYLCIPRHTSERRAVIPMVFAGPDVIASDSTITIPGATLFEFGLLQSRMFSAWQRGVGTRLERRLRFSVHIVYNNFPFPDASTPYARARVDAAASAVLASRAVHRDVALADLYDPRGMPADLRRAHELLDSAVDAAFEYRGRAIDCDRLAFLSERWERLSHRLSMETDRVALSQ